MIKLIIFDLDGVLVKTKDIHYTALNCAISSIAGDEYMISHEDHIKRFDGKPTRVKLEMLTIDRGLPEKLHEEIYQLKQQNTVDLLEGALKRDEKLLSIEDGKKIKTYDVDRMAGLGTPEDLQSFLREESK